MTYALTYIFSYTIQPIEITDSSHVTGLYWDARNEVIYIVIRVVFWLLEVLTRGIYIPCNL